MVGALALSWSGGKDSALALRLLLAEGARPTALVTTVTDVYDRVSMHGVRTSLLRRQAHELGFPLIEIGIPSLCTNEVYEARFARAFGSAHLRGVEEVSFGDLFLSAVRAHRESWLATLGLRAGFPVWGRETPTVARQFVEDGFRAVIVCVDPLTLDATFAGREFDQELLGDLPPSVDACGENGEFHTFVYDGPIFRRPVCCTRGEVVEREGFVFCDLLPCGQEEA